jgi:integrase
MFLGAVTSSGWGKCRICLDARIAELGKPLPDWGIHDLRRTAATGMADIGIQPHVVEAVLNHVSGSKRGVAGVYNRSTYSAERKIALKKWADHVLAVVEGRKGNVTPLHGRA